MGLTNWYWVRLTNYDKVGLTNRYRVGLRIRYWAGLGSVAMKFEVHCYYKEKEFLYTTFFFISASFL